MMQCTTCTEPYKAWRVRGEDKDKLTCDKDSYWSKVNRTVMTNGIRSTKDVFTHVWGVNGSFHKSNLSSKWNHRHDVVFRSQEPSLLRLLLSCKEEARLWSCRLPRQDKEVAEAWCHAFCKP